MIRCNACPRHCPVDRAAGEVGFCRMGNTLRIARAAPHKWEEPPISGTRGSGTVFFSGCNLGCIFCQNAPISHGGQGFNVTDDEFVDTVLQLQERGVHNINLVTPTPFAHLLIPLLERLKPQLHVPLVYNCGGYESPEILRALEGLVDIYLPDFKYVSPALSHRYSGVSDYATVAEMALVTMHESVGETVFDGDGILKKGMIVRHLVLPGSRADSMAVLDRLATILPIGGIKLSLMSQYTPMAGTPYPELSRRVTTFEYASVLKHAINLGFDGYFQSRSSSGKQYIPDFEGDPNK